MVLDTLLNWFPNPLFTIGCQGRYSMSRPNPYLTVEKELLAFCVKIGYPHTQKQVLSLVQQMIDHQGHCNIWMVDSASGKAVLFHCHVRAMATDEDTLNRYYDTLEDTLRMTHSTGILRHV